MFPLLANFPAECKSAPPIDDTVSRCPIFGTMPAVTSSPLRASAGSSIPAKRPPVREGTPFPTPVTMPYFGGTDSPDFDDFPEIVPDTPPDHPSWAIDTSDRMVSPHSIEGFTENHVAHFETDVLVILLSSSNQLEFIGRLQRHCKMQTEIKGPRQSRECRN